MYLVRDKNTIMQSSFHLYVSAELVRRAVFKSLVVLPCDHSFVHYSLFRSTTHSHTDYMPIARHLKNGGGGGGGGGICIMELIQDILSEGKL